MVFFVSVGFFLIVIIVWVLGYRWTIIVLLVCQLLIFLTKVNADLLIQRPHCRLIIVEHGHVFWVLLDAQMEEVRIEFFDLDASLEEKVVLYSGLEVHVLLIKVLLRLDFGQSFDLYDRDLVEQTLYSQGAPCRQLAVFVLLELGFVDWSDKVDGVLGMFAHSANLRQLFLVLTEVVEASLESCLGDVEFLIEILQDLLEGLFFHLIYEVMGLFVQHHVLFEKIAPPPGE